MSNAYYLYLTEESWVETWETGGRIPINPASAYLSNSRQGTKTPDETIQRTISGMPDWVLDNLGLGRFASLAPNSFAIITDLNIEVVGGPKASITHGRADSRVEDGLILRLSTQLSGDIADRLGKQACVQIRSMPALIKVLDKQIGAKCKSGPVEYREGFARSHFLKSSADAWQREYRLLWLTDDVHLRTVVIPPRTAFRVCW